MAVVTITKCYCDCCGKEIPIEHKTDVIGITHNVITTGRINCSPIYHNTDMRRYGIDLCELCAEKISHQLDLLKLKLLERHLGIY